VVRRDTTYHIVTQDHKSDRSDRSSPPPSSNDESGRKERVLHARIPESLDDAIRAAASELGISVSNLVRNVLANTVEVVEAAALRVPQRAAARAASVSAAADARVLGWQEAILNLNAVCERCNAILARGTRAAISVPDRPSAQRAIHCLACLEEVTREPAQ